jgi:SAM-dependent methyltransferase
MGVMSNKIEKIVQTIFRKMGFSIISLSESYFHSNNYLRHNARRLEHLASLRILVAGKTVLEVGAGIGDHSHYYADRGCQLTVTENRKSNLRYLKKHYPQYNVQYLNMENAGDIKIKFDIIHCYGLLYHLRTPERAIDFLSDHCKSLLFLETCVSFGDAENINLINEDVKNPTQAASGTGCRPTRLWIIRQLKNRFQFVYIPKTQPNHEEFPIDWTSYEKHKGLARAVFIASREMIHNDDLTTELLDMQERHP